MSGMLRNLFLLLALFALTACAATAPHIPTDKASVQPGSSVTRAGTELALLGEPIEVGEPLPAVPLVDPNMQEADLAGRRGEVLLISMVPSLDTGVCERQTHLLGEAEDLPEEVRRITVSRDLPFAQKRFAEESGLEGIEYLSDYRMGEFGRGAGLLVDEIHLLARSVILVDREGIVRYIQVVPELTHLPDMEAAFERAEALSRE